VRFVLYTEKTVSQCLTAINERMHVKETSTRPALDGWVEKSGAFSLSLSAPVMGRFARRTALKAKVERENGVTIIQGSVPGGVSRNGQIAIFIALALIALTIIGSGNLLIGLLLVALAAVLYIPMQGDYLNSAALLDEVQKTLKAKSAPPKTATSEAKLATSRQPATKSTAATRNTATKSTTTRAAPKSTASRSAASKSPAAPRSTTRAVPKPKPAARKQPALDMDEFPSTSVDGESLT
jgi:hypothetical protein